MPTKNRDHLELLVTKEEMTQSTIERLFKWNPPAKANGDYSFTGLLTLLYCKADPVNQQKLLKEFNKIRNLDFNIRALVSDKSGEYKKIFFY